MINVNRHPSPRDILQFGCAMLGGFAFLSALSWLAAWRNGAPALGWVGSNGQIAALLLLAIGCLLFGLTRLAPAAARPVYVVWMTVGLGLGRVMSTLLLTVMFLMILPVFSVIVRMSDPLRKRIRLSESYWEEYKPHETALERMRRMF